MSELDALTVRRAAAWADKTTWNGLYTEAWRLAVPYRRPVNGPSSSDKGASRVAELMDSTAVVSTLRGAARMQQDLFPPGQDFFRLRQTPLNKQAIRGAARRQIGANGGPPLDEAALDAEIAGRIAAVDKDLADVTEQVAPWFRTGEWDNAVSELCIDAYVGTGVLLLIEGTRDEVKRRRPVRFVTLPVDECAFEPGPYGDVGALFWKTKMSRRAILAAFPKGRFPKAFLDAADEKNGKPDEEVELRQDFIQEDKGKYVWKLVVSVDESEEPVAVQRYRTQPFAVIRYFRVPGETHGRGPVLMAVPTIRTLNRAMELMLKAFALSMLGIWGYRPGGTFNPNTVSKQPGAFWPMQATGGVMGPDVFRLDTGGGRAEMSGSFILQELRTQIQAALHDESLPEGGATPKSAAEIAARMARVKQNWIGAFGRMINDLIPVVVRRVIEILSNLGLLTSDVSIDQILVGVEVMSPLAQALKADAWRSTLEAMQLVAQLEGPEGVARRFDLDQMMPEMIKDLGVDARWVRDAAAVAAWDEKRLKQAQQQALAASMIDQPKGWADAAATANDAMNPEAAA